MLRDYQAQAVDAVVSALNQGERVCLVAPTGAGKTVMMCAVASALQMQTVWVTHRDALIDQSAAALEKAGLSTGIYTAGRRDGLDAQVIVASWQTVIARGEAPPAELLLIDEAHHVQGKKWRTILDHYQNAKLVGATATPQRGDGRPLGDIFTKLVVAAQYSELLQQGHLTPCRVFCPPEDISPNLARHPLEAYQQKCPGTKAIGFAASIELAKEYAEAFTRAGYHSRLISQRTKPAERVETIAAFKRGQIKVLWSVQVLTEGFDCPDAETCIIARGCQHSGTFLQMVGRVLRAAADKKVAYLLDLAGVCNTHQMPTCDRIYSLEGKAISPVKPLCQCRKCGLTWDGAYPCECGWAPPQKPQKPPEITGDELLEQQDLPLSKVYEQVRRRQKERGYSLAWTQTQLKKRFGRDVLITDATEDEKRAQYLELKRFAESRGYKPTYAAVRFKTIVGHWPSRAYDIPQKRAANG